jgi:hypothetical protein
MLELRGRIPPTRQVTLDELLVAMEKVFEEQTAREEKASRIELPPVMNITIPEFDIEDRMLEVYGRVETRSDSEGLVLFNALLDEQTPRETILTLLPVLHLVQDKRLHIFQEQFFGEIFVKLIPGRKPEAQPKAKRPMVKIMTDGTALDVSAFNPDGTIKPAAEGAEKTLIIDAKISGNAGERGAMKISANGSGRIARSGAWHGGQGGGKAGDSASPSHSSPEAIDTKSPDGRIIGEATMAVKTGQKAGHYLGRSLLVAPAAPGIVHFVQMGNPKD